MDFSQIESVLGLATTALSATGKAVTTVEAIKKLVTSEKQSEKGEVSKMLNDLATELTAANLMNVQLSSALKSLNSELRLHDEFVNEKSRYEAFQTPQNDMVFRLKAEMANGQPPHYICPVCLNRDRLISYVVGNGDYKVCQANREHTYRFADTDYRMVSSHRDDFGVY